MERHCNELKLGSQHDQRPYKGQRRELYKRKAEARVAVPHAREHVRSPAAAKGREGKLGN